MSFISLLLLALIMSMDAFTVAICKGISSSNIKLSAALKTGILFGLVEGITPVLGWLFGIFLKHYIEGWDHWIFFLIMLFLGGRMIYNSFQQDGCEIEERNDPIWILLIIAISTSVDAFAVGAGLAVVSVNILLAAIMIGVMTFIMVTIGICLGKKIGIFVGKKGEFVGGAVLIGLGIYMLMKGLSN